VRNFCDQARKDVLFGPIFAAKVHDCEVHHQVASNFSSHFPLGTARSGGRPYPLHAGLPIERKHFDRLLAGLTAAIKEHLPPMLPPRRPPRPAAGGAEFLGWNLSLHGGARLAQEFLPSRQPV
jgi:hemoglobin